MKLQIDTRLAKWILRSTSYALTCGGLAGFLWFGYGYADGLLDERKSERLFAERLAQARNYRTEGKQASAKNLESTVASSERAGTPAGKTKVTKVTAAVAEDANLIGKIEIPRVNVSAVVREGVDDYTLGRAVGHVPGTAFPGKEGNLALAAHRDRYFRGLRNIKIGDEIRVRTAEGLYRYSVDSTRIVAPTDVSVLDPTPEPSITLITCYPFTYIGPAPQRFIVRGRRIDGATSVSARNQPTTVWGVAPDSPGM
ncbi:MAG: class D sortase [Bryobacteraceae bacterium]